MGKEQVAEFYDQKFEGQTAYHVNYKDSFYYVHWTQVIYYLKRYYEAPHDLRLLEIGCGTGQFAEYLQDEGFHHYEGFDFSPKAVEIARKRQLGLHFFEGDALDTQVYDRPYDLVICLEVLEHLEKDLKVLCNLRQGTDIIFSIPNFDDPGHVRWFTSERQIKSRYYKYIDLERITRVGNIYICQGKVNGFKPNLVQRFLKTREQVGLSSFTKRIRHRLKNMLKIKD